MARVAKEQDGIALIGVLLGLVVIAALIVIGLRVHDRTNPDSATTITKTSTVKLPIVPAVHTVEGVTLSDAVTRKMQPYGQTLLESANTQLASITPRYFTASDGQISTIGTSTAILWGDTTQKVESTDITAWVSASIKQSAGPEGATITPYATYTAIVRDDSGQRYKLLCSNVRSYPVKSDVEAEPQYIESCIGEIQKSTVWFDTSTRTFATAKPQMVKLLDASTINMSKE